MKLQTLDQASRAAFLIAGWSGGETRTALPIMISSLVEYHGALGPREMRMRKLAPAIPPIWRSENTGNTFAVC